MNKKALITGASRGIGEAIARKLASNGYDLVLVCQNNIEKMNLLKDSLQSDYHITCTNYQGDIADPAFVSSIFNNLDRLDVLVNNAGVSYIGLLQDMSIEDWNHVISTNLNSIFYTSRLAIKLMLKEHKGRIINISSMWGNVGASMEVAYSTTKGGMNAFTRALAKELAPSNIQVNAVACGVIDTDMNSCFSDDEMSDLIDDIPIGRIGSTYEVADMVYELTQAPSYMTGQIIGLDGGYI